MKSIFVTGAASGIGRATAQLFAGRGWRVGLFDLDREGVEAVASQASEEAVWGRLDVRDYGEFQACVRRFSEATGGRMEVLFNAAGVMRMGPFGATAVEEHRLTLEVNALGVVHGVHASLELLRATPGARVITMGSAAAIYGVPDLATYSASKFFVRGLTEALNLELATEGIAVTDVMPLYADTPMIRAQRYRAGTLRTFGAKLSAADVARLVWRAAHGSRVHWIPGPLLKLFHLAAGALPPLARPTMKLLDRR